MSRAVVRGAAASVAMTATGVVAGYGFWIVTMFALIPFLLFLVFGVAPFVALLCAAAIAWCTSRRPCAAPEWAQRHRHAFWVGALGVLAFICAQTVVPLPGSEPFW
ncbi:hypothetical protein [Mycolicibacterium arseniciresistens]|jgi:hypothetical protein|uniref:Uncharacterized protein n=1 Tax=Mycolicibacterium arseniciresistens TaxID=3062257 RepID=A0ABT8UJR8_9MYCO|nr:hypothetical protein [Mycolicibacterium arseniciresistens]MDO3638016.1 hypothetical protein [Mycolicibacterium arseniciresistens]